VGSTPDTWNVEINQENVVSFLLNLDDQHADEFTVAATKCNNDDAYSISSSDNVADMSVTFINDVDIVDVTFCAKVVLSWNNGEAVEEVATLTFTMDVQATETDTETLETDTPETALQVTPQEDEVGMTMTVTRPQPTIDLAVQNTSPLYFGEDVLIAATSPRDYQFQLIGAQTQGTSDTPHDLTIVDGGPGPSGAVFKVNGFRLVDFTGSPITITLVIAWDVNGFDSSSGNNRNQNHGSNRNHRYYQLRHLVPLEVAASESGKGQYQLQIRTVLLPQETEVASRAQQQTAYGTMNAAAALIGLTITTVLVI
jgi:hypothetical protein